jgi:hypothetical protein
MRENDALIEQYMDMFPKEFMAAFGMSGALSDPGVFFTTYIASWLWPIIAGIAGLLAGTRAVAADLDRGFLDLPLATRISRGRYLGASIWMQVIVMVVLAVSASSACEPVGRLAGADFDFGRFMLGGVLCFAFGCAIAGVATLVSVATLSRGITSAIVGGVLIGMYLLFVVTQIAEGWAWLAPLSAWHHFETTKLIDQGVFPLGDVALFALFAVGGWLAALWAFGRNSPRSADSTVRGRPGAPSVTGGPELRDFRSVARPRLERHDRPNVSGAPPDPSPCDPAPPGRRPCPSTRSAGPRSPAPPDLCPRDAIPAVAGRGKRRGTDGSRSGVSCDCASGPPSRSSRAHRGLADRPAGGRSHRAVGG